MVIEHTALIILGAALIIERLLSFIRERAHRAEMHSLCDRLQAGTLKDYELSRLAERAARDSRKQAAPLRESLSQTTAGEGIDAAVFAVEAQDAARGLGID